MGKLRNAYKILVQQPEMRRPLGRSRCRWKDNINVDVKRKRVRFWTGLT
jgi:hypothetical protein